MKIYLLIPFLLCILHLKSQDWKPVNGTKDVSNHYILLKNASIYLADGNYITKGKLLIKNEKIIAVGAEVETPKNTLEIDLDGKFIYPAFIELHSSFGIADPKSKRSRSPQIESKKKGPYYWNEAVKPEIRAIDLIKYDLKEAKKMRSMGFGSVLSHQHDGVIRGSSVLMNLNEEGRVLIDDAAFHYSFFKGSSKQDYPSSLMGMIALIKQAEHDAKWYAENEEATDFNASLKALNNYSGLPQMFHVESELSILRAAKIGAELEKNFIIKGNGKEYKRIDEIKSLEVDLIIPVNFSDAYDVIDPFRSKDLSLARMKDWELAPYNLAILDEAEIPFSITSNGTKEAKAFYQNMKEAVNSGLDRNQALYALTQKPAEILKMQEKLGSIEAGKIANFNVFSDTVFTSKAVLESSWVDGKRLDFKQESSIQLAGNYSLNINKKLQYDLKIEEIKDSYSAKVSAKGENEFTKTKIQLTGNRINLTVPNEKGIVSQLTGTVSDSKSRIWFGKTNINGNWVDWGAIKKNDGSEKTDTSQVIKKVKPPSIYYPNMAYGWDSVPSKAKTLVFRNASIWTNEKEGILRKSDLVLKDGKILMVGYKIDLEIMFPKGIGEYQEVDLKGKHITTGIIDEHSHIAISRGVNESGKSVTAEVSISDVVNSDDINIYRQLAGGVTTSQLLHGSANPIGGQSAIIKLRWGKSPEEMKVEGANGFIKFALGENVKQSNWGDKNTIRFPQTRMGVEQVYYDAFYRAKEYQAEWTLYNAKNKREQKQSTAPRYDLELEVLSEILDSLCFVTCHSYIQSEINMLMHVADSMGFTINTFTHILEGYKVADKLREHGAAASTFSDWWAYKFEVNDAIPFNGAILHNNGVLTGFNSDDAEMGRRLNQEAAKAVKYGGVSEEEAWKFVTLNPAKMLHLDDRLGSIKEGKDADIVIWSDNPLSVYAKVEQTYIDGIKYFDLEHDADLRKRNQAEKERLIQKMLNEKKAGKPVRKIKEEKQLLYECETIQGL